MLSLDQMMPTTQLTTRDDILSPATRSAENDSDNSSISPLRSFNIWQTCAPIAKLGIVNPYLDLLKR